MSEVSRLAKISQPAAGISLWPPIFLWFLHLLDALGRWEVFLSLQQHLAFINSAYFTPIAIGLGAFLIHFYYKSQFLHATSNEPTLYGASSERLTKRKNLRWPWTATLIAATAIPTAVVAIPVWLLLHDYPTPQLTVLIPPPAPRIYTTAELNAMNPPRQIRVAPAQQITQLSTGERSPNIIGSGNIVGSTVLNLGPDNATKEQRQKIRVALAGFMNRGTELRGRCRTDDPSSKLEMDAETWFKEIQWWLLENLDSSFHGQFILERPTAFFPTGIPKERVNLWTGINQRVETLDKFIDQFK